eukprot:TRINITY_DN77780_c0_g1_i1.p1 TRINITY_DN77780_c0_g1~~TRINITY_DN77780_c0_g1_i1.p1  ORF type:complete len:250 (+),score=38.02 TRINITY_DN77780_c0_g1_i1:87-836(+)
MTIGTIRCVVFDLDDTLWNTIETLNDAHEVMRQALGLRCPEVEAKYGDTPVFRDEMKVTMGAFPEQAHDFTFVRMETLTRLIGDKEIAQEIYDVWYKKRNDPALFPGVVRALGSLRAAGIRVGTLTDGNSDPSTIASLREIVDFTVSAAEVGTSKPDRKMFACCEAKSECSAGELVMVGDNLDKDVIGARNAGWRGIWCRPPQSKTLGTNHEHHFVQVSEVTDGETSADAIVDHVSEVEAVLRSWAAES